MEWRAIQSIFLFSIYLLRKEFPFKSKNGTKSAWAIPHIVDVSLDDVERDGRNQARWAVFPEEADWFEDDGHSSIVRLFRCIYTCKVDVDDYSNTWSSMWWISPLGPAHNPPVYIYISSSSEWLERVSSGWCVQPLRSVVHVVPKSCFRFNFSLALMAVLLTSMALLILGLLIGNQSIFFTSSLTEFW